MTTVTGKRMAATTRQPTRRTSLLIFLLFYVELLMACSGTYTCPLQLHRAMIRTRLARVRLELRSYTDLLRIAGRIAYRLDSPIPIPVSGIPYLPVRVSRLLLNPAVHMVFLSILIALMFLWIPYVSAYVVDALNNKESYATIVIGEVARSMIWWLPVCVIFPFVQNAIKILAVDSAMYYRLSLVVLAGFGRNGSKLERQMRREGLDDVDVSIVLNKGRDMFIQLTILSLYDAAQGLWGMALVVFVLLPETPQISALYALGLTIDVVLTYRQGVDLRPAYDRLNAADNKLRRLELELLPELRALDGDPAAIDWLLLERYEPEGYHRGQAKTSADTRSIAYSGARWLVVKITDLIALAGGAWLVCNGQPMGVLMVFLGWSGQGSNALHALMRIQQAGMEFRPTINQLFGYARISVSSPTSVFDTPYARQITAGWTPAQMAGLREFVPQAPPDRPRTLGAEPRRRLQEIGDTTHATTSARLQ